MTATPLPCAALSPTGYACTLERGHAGEHEARKAVGRTHAWALGAVVATWATGFHRIKELTDSQMTVEPAGGPSFEDQCAAELAASDRDEHEAIVRGDAAPEEVEARRKQMRVVE